MKKNTIETGVVRILCATSLALSIIIPAIASTPANKVTPTNRNLPKTTPGAKVTPTTKPTPTENPAPVATQSSSPNGTPKTPPLVAVPTLTPQILKNFPILYGQLIEVKLTPDRQQIISQRISRNWMTNLGMRSNVMQTLALETQILNGTPAEKTQVQAKLIGDLREQVLNGDTESLWLLSFFDAAPKHWLAQGQPPLNRMTTDISADALCFMVNEVMGKQVATADGKLKNSIAAKLTAEYANIPPNIKQELFQMPKNWLKFKEGDWIRRGEDFRELMRVHWGQNLEAYIPELRSMSKLRANRLAKIKADPTSPWDTMSSLQRQGALQKPDLDFQTGLRNVEQVKSVQLNNYIDRMQVATAIGNSPTRYPLKIKIK